MGKKKILKIFLIIIALIFIIFLVHTIRNFIIITDLQSKIAKYSDNKNHHIKIISNQENGTTLTTNYYKKNNKKAVFIERNLNGEIVKLSIYDDGENNHTYTETTTEKIASLNSGFIEVQIYNGTETDNLLQKMLSSMVANIKTVNENGKKYYKLSNINSTYSIIAKNQYVLVDSDTGLLYKSLDNYSTIEREYDFNNVDDSVFTEPDISEYKTQ